MSRCGVRAVAVVDTVRQLIYNRAQRDWVNASIDRRDEDCAREPHYVHEPRHGLLRGPGG